MRALTLRHPWAYCIARLGKNIENRTWAPTGALEVGEYFAIHGGVAPKGKNLKEAEEDFKSLVASGLMPSNVAFENTIGPGIVCLARFAGTVALSDSPWFKGPVGWSLADTLTLMNPVHCNGAQGLWVVPDPLYKQVRREWIDTRAIRAEAKR